MQSALTDPLMVLFAALAGLGVLVPLVWQGPRQPPPLEIAAIKKIPTFRGQLVFVAVVTPVIAAVALWYGQPALAVGAFDLLILGWIAAVAGLALVPGAATGPLRLIAAGLALAMASGLAAWLFARPFLTGAGDVETGLIPFLAGIAMTALGLARLARRAVAGGRR